MFPDVHDSLLVAYTVDAINRELVLSLRPHHGSGTSPFSVVFRGAVAHCFEAPLLPAILFGITSMTAETLLAREWSSIERGFKACGWPGPWADTLANATRFARTAALQAFQIESSYGLSGWVIAQSARVCSVP